MFQDDFSKFATKHCGINSIAFDDYKKHANKRLMMPTNSFINPTIIEERAMHGVVIDVFSRLMMDRIIFIGDAIDEFMANTIIAQLLFLEQTDSKKDISLYINSPGGSVYDGLAIYDTMQYISSDISSICTGMAASMASILLCAGTKGKRFILPHSRVMIHQPMGGVSGQATEMEIAVNEINKLKTELYEIISKHSGKSLKAIKADADRDHWMTAEEALKYGMVDDILNS